MNSYEKSAEFLMRRGDEMIAQKQRKNVIIKRTAMSVSGICAAAAIGFGVWNSSSIKNAVSPDPNDRYMTTETTTAATTEKTSPPTTTAITSTVRTTTESITTQTTSTQTSPPVIVTVPAATTVRTTSTACSTAEITSTASALLTTEQLTNNTMCATSPTQTTSTVIDTKMTAAITEMPTTTAKPLTSPSNTQPGCLCKAEQLKGKTYYSNETEVPGEMIGEFLGMTDVYVQYWNGYKGYALTSFTVQAHVYEYAEPQENKLILRYKNSDCYYEYKTT